MDHILIDRRWHLSVLDIRSFTEADCDTDHYLVIANVRERLALIRQATHNFDGEIFNLSYLSDLEIRKQYRIDILNKVAALGILSDSEDINRIWENIKENIKTSAKESVGLHELQLHKPRFDEE
jgi:hypothetical protein